MTNEKVHQDRYHINPKIPSDHDPKTNFHLLWQFLFSWRPIIRLWPWPRDVTGLGLLNTSLVTNIGIKHGFSCINICQVPWEVLKTEAKGRSFQHLPMDLANVNALKNHVQSLLLHKNWKHLLHFALFFALFCFAFSPMSREHNFHWLCLLWGRAVHISWWQQFCGSSTSTLKVA